MYPICSTNYFWGQGNSSGRRQNIAKKFPKVLATFGGILLQIAPKPQH